MSTPPTNVRPASSGRPDELGRIAFALDRLTDRIEASETRTGLAISGVEHSVRHAMARIEAAEREHMAVATRFDAAAERLEAEQVRAAERLRLVEEEAGPRSAEALKAIEARLARVEGAPDPAELIEDVVTRLGQRVAEAEERTGAALESLRGSLAEFDDRLQASGSSVRVEFDQRLESLAEQLTRKVEDARSEIAEQLAAASTDDVEARLDRMAQDLANAEQRSAHAIETMGREVLTMAETLNRRVRSAEQRSAEAIEQVGGEIARIAGAVENRLGRVDQLHAEALERLGAEIGRITERLTDRIIQSERRAAQAIDDVGEQVAKVTERIEQRHERASSDLAERLRASEARTAKLFEDARLRLEASAPEPVAVADPESLELRPAQAGFAAATEAAAGGALRGRVPGSGTRDCRRGGGDARRRLVVDQSFEAEETLAADEALRARGSAAEPDAAAELAEEIGADAAVGGVRRGAVLARRADRPSRRSIRATPLSARKISRPPTALSRWLETTASPGWTSMTPSSTPTLEPDLSSAPSGSTPMRRPRSKPAHCPPAR